MPGLEGDLKEWQTQEVNFTQGEAEGDIDLFTVASAAIPLSVLSKSTLMVDGTGH